MPYTLEQVSPRLYFVVDAEGKRYSKKPMYKRKAREQQKALYASENRKIKGGGGMFSRSFESEFSKVSKQLDKQREKEQKKKAKSHPKQSLAFDRFGNPADEATHEFVLAQKPKVKFVKGSGLDDDPTAALKALGQLTTADITKNPKITQAQIKASDTGLLKNYLARQKHQTEEQPQTEMYQYTYKKAYDRTIKALQGHPDEIWNPELENISAFSGGDHGISDPNQAGINDAVKYLRSITDKPAPKQPEAQPEEEEDHSSGFLPALNAVGHVAGSIVSKILDWF